MNHLKILLLLSLLFHITSCSKSNIEENDFPLSSGAEGTTTEQSSGFHKDSLHFQTIPSNVLLTGVPNVRLTTIYKVNYTIEKRFGKEYQSVDIGSNSFHYKLMPGLAAVYGYNLVNVSLYDLIENKKKLFFEKPVLIKTIYYPSFSKDTLDFQPVNRNYVMISAYNEDTNMDGFVTIKDLRRFYLFNIHGVRQKPLIPENYSVVSSDYDSANDLRFVFAQLDSKANGQRDPEEPTHIFWIDLKDPNRTGRVY